MSKLNRLLGMAQKALDSQSSGSSRGRSGSTDWVSMAKNAAESLTSDGGDRGTQRSAPAPRTAADPRSGADRSSSRSSSPSSRDGWAPYHPDGAAGGASAGTAPATSGSAPLSAEDQRAIARYDYLVRTADPEQLETVHREAFDRLTPGQRTEVQSRMREELDPSERPRSDSSADLARSATRLGAMDPRRLTGLLYRAGMSRSGSSGSGMRRAATMGAVGAAGGLLGVVAGGAIATSIGGSLLTQAIGSGIDVDAMMPDLQMDLGELGALGDVDLGSLADANLGDVDVAGMADAGLGNLSETSLNDIQGFDLGNLDLGDIGGFFGR